MADHSSLNSPAERNMPAAPSAAIPDGKTVLELIAEHRAAWRRWQEAEAHRAEITERMEASEPHRPCVTAKELLAQLDGFWRVQDAFSHDRLDEIFDRDAASARRHDQEDRARDLEARRKETHELLAARKAGWEACRRNSGVTAAEIEAEAAWNAREDALDRLVAAQCRTAEEARAKALHIANDLDAHGDEKAERWHFAALLRSLVVSGYPELHG